MIGRKPFYIEPSTSELRFSLRPNLPLWLFMNSTEPVSGGTIADSLIIKFKLFSSIDVTYHNTHGRDIFDLAPKRYDVRFSDGSYLSFDDESLPSSIAVQIRKVISVKSIDVFI